MAFSVRMPELGESVTEGTVTRWHKQLGDRVEVDEPLLEVSTDKVDTEIPSPVAGVLHEIVAEEDTTVEVGGVLAVIDDSAGAYREAAVTLDHRPGCTVLPSPAYVPAAGWFGAHGAPGTLHYWDGEVWSVTQDVPDAMFVSYSRADAVAVRDLVEDLRAAQLRIWLDEQLATGVEWWAEILRQIRGAAVFVHALSAASMASEPCRAERSYAEALGIPILPVQVGEANLRASPYGRRQLLDLRGGGRREAVRLVADVLREQRRRGPLPDPLPDPPPVPYDYLERVALELGAPELAAKAQLRIFDELHDRLADTDDPSVCSNILDLLRQLHERDDAVRTVIRRVEQLLRTEQR